MPAPSPKLPLTPEERAKLRACKVKLQDITSMNVLELSSCLDSSIERAKYLRALAEFQMIPSIGPKVAQRVVDLGFYSLEEIKDENGADLINRLEQLYGYWEDPCLEDSLRCIVHHANNPEDNKCWFDFTEERKKYRQQYGYPITRPKLAWHEV
jgi:hypothetical protein